MKLKRRHQELKAAPRTVETITASCDSSILFDREIDVSDEVWRQAVDCLISLERNDDSSWSPYENLAIGMAVACPERWARVKVADKYITDRMQFIAKYKEEDKMRECAGVAMSVVLLSPDKRGDLDLSDHLFESLYQDLHSAEDIDDKIEVAFYLTMLFPERRDSFGIDDSFITSVNSMVEEQIHANEIAVLQMLMLTVLIKPERRELLHVDKSALMQARAYMQESYGKNWLEYMGAAMILAVLSADEVRRTEQGFELIHRQEIEPSPGLPERNIAA